MEQAALSPTASAFRAFSRDKLVGQYWPRLQACAGSLTSEQIWWRPNESSNSVGNLLLHLNGNVQQWLVGSFNRLRDTCDRPSEFSERDHIPASALLARLGATMEQAAKVLRRLAASDLSASLEIQG